MLAVRSSGGGLNGGGHPPHHATPLKASKVHQSRCAAPSKTEAEQPRKTAAAQRRRDMEDAWYLRMVGASKEHTVAHHTGMVYR